MVSPNALNSILVTLSPRVTVCNNWQFLNASSPIVCTRLGIVIDSSAVLSNIRALMFVNLLLKVMFFNEKHSANVCWSIVSTLSGIVTATNDELDLNAPDSICVTFLPIVKEYKFELEPNEKEGIVVSPFPIVSSFTPLLKHTYEPAKVVTLSGIVSEFNEVQL